MGTSSGCYWYPVGNIMVAIKPPPNIVVHHMGDAEKGDFLKLRHLKLRLQYPDGSMSEGFIHDVIVRGKMDASVIVAYDMSAWREPRVWLRSCVRPAACSRVPFPNSHGCGWELPAGLVDPGETPHQCAIRELYEEVGFEVDPNFVTLLGPPSWGSVGLAPELIHFYAVEVTGLRRQIPPEDGSPLERYGDCTLVPVSSAMQVGDMKTSLGAHRLARLL